MESLLRDIIVNVPDKHILDECIISIDGIFQAIRVYDGMNIIQEVVYQKTDTIRFAHKKEYLRKILDDLYIKIGELIGDF